MNEGIIPGSLAERILKHITVAKGEFTADELAEVLEVDVSECRAALGSLRKAFKLATKMEDGVATYRLAGEPAGHRIPGSAATPIAAPKPKETRAEKAAAKSPASGKQRGPASKQPEIKETTLAWLKTHPGGQSRGEIEAGLGINGSTLKVALQALVASGQVERIGSTSATIYSLAGDKVDLDAHAEKRKARAREHGMQGAEKSAAMRPVQTSAPKATRKPKAERPKANLAHYGAQAKAPAARGYDHAISDDGTVAIKPRSGGEALCLALSDITALVAFLEKTQFVWKSVPA